MKSLVDDETPSSVCTFLRLSSVARVIKTEKTRRCRPPRGRREHITAALFFYFTCCVPFINERFDQKTFSVVVLPHKNLESSSHMPLFSIY